jgi:hypothetical protein
MRTPTIRVLLGTVLAFFAAASTGCKTKSSASDGPQQAPEPRIDRAPAPRLVCPLLGSVLVPAPQSEDRHRVILKWKASHHADVKHSDAVGYCVYRVPKPNAPAAELLNHLPFPETQCVDDSVENGKQYYYVVRAISARGMLSDVSKPPAPAKIPTTPLSSFKTAGASIPLCRESPSIKSP